MSEQRRRTRRYAQENAPVYDELHADEDSQVEAEVIATNGTVKLTCTLAAMMGAFALFLCFAEKRSPAIRQFSVQSVALSAFHLIVGLVLLIVGSVFGLIPILGFLVKLVCWLVYIAALIAVIVVRIRMMLAAYQGLRFDLPLIGGSLNRFM